MELRVGPKQNMGKVVREYLSIVKSLYIYALLSKQIEDVVLTIPMPKIVSNVNLNPSGISIQISYNMYTYISIPSVGIANYDPVGRVVNWNVSYYMQVHIYQLIIFLLD